MTCRRALQRERGGTGALASQMTRGPEAGRALCRPRKRNRASASSPRSTITTESSVINISSSTSARAWTSSDGLRSEMKTEYWSRSPYPSMILQTRRSRFGLAMSYAMRYLRRATP